MYGAGEEKKGKEKGRKGDRREREGWRERGQHGWKGDC